MSNDPWNVVIGGPDSPSAKLFWERAKQEFERLNERSDLSSNYPIDMTAAYVTAITGMSRQADQIRALDATIAGLEARVAELERRLEECGRGWMSFEGGEGHHD